MNDSGCKDCTTRKPGCHANCEKYKKFREKIDRENQKRRDSIAHYMGGYYHT